MAGSRHVRNENHVGVGWAPETRAAQVHLVVGRSDTHSAAGDRLRCRDGRREDLRWCSEHMLGLSARLRENLDLLSLLLHGQCNPLVEYTLYSCGKDDGQCNPLVEYTLYSCGNDERTGR